MANKSIKEAPPRYIDFFSQAVVILSGFLQQFGWAFFSFGMIFFWAFGMQSALGFFLSPMGQTETVSGTYQRADMSMATENDVRIYKHIYTYIVDFKEYEGKSYGPLGFYKEGDPVEVKYAKKHTERSYMVGLRRSIFSPWVLFVLIFPIIGLSLVVYQIRKNIHYLRMIRDGHSTKGKRTKKEATGSTVTINDQVYPVYAYTFEFSHNGKTYQAKAKTHQTSRLEDDPEELILFDNLNPDYNMVFDVATSAPRIDANGYLKPAAPKKIFLFVLPAFAVLINWLGYLLTHTG